MNAVFSSRSTGDGGISPVSAPGICVTANCSAIDGLPPSSVKGSCTKIACSGWTDNHPAKRGGVASHPWQAMQAAYVTYLGSSTSPAPCSAPCQCPEIAFAKGFRRPVAPLCRYAQSGGRPGDDGGPQIAGGGPMRARRGPLG